MHTPLTRLFPTPHFLAFPAVGLDFSDATMRFVRLEQTLTGILPTKYAEMSIPEGCMQGGKIADERKFIDFLKVVRREHNFKYVRVAIPESQVYSFTLAIDNAARENIKGAIDLVLEDNIPLKVAEAVYDFNVILTTERDIVVQVQAIPEATAQTFYACFNAAGFVPISFELDGQAIARAVLPKGDKGAYMIVDFGANRTSITVVTNGTAVFTSTSEFGGKNLVDLLSKELKITPEEATKLKREQGITSGGGYGEVFTVLAGGISALKDEINRRYIYWHDKKSQFGALPNIETIYLCGGHSNMRGLADYLSMALKLKVTQVNPWINCVSFDHDIPAMQAESSMSYVTAIGLALADYIYD